MNELERLESLLRVEPPADLDALVMQRLGNALASLRSETSERQKRGEPAEKRGAPELIPAPAVALPLAERCVYAVGLVAFGTQTVQVLVRFVWRSLAG